MKDRQTKAERISKAKARIRSDNSFAHNKFLHDEEIEYMLQALQKDIFESVFPKARIKAERYRLFFLLLLYTGARCSEILDCNSCDIRDGCITVRGLKGSNTRTIPLPEDFYIEIQEYIEIFAVPNGGFLFNAFFTDRYARMRFKRYLPDGSKKSIHSLRHSMGVNSYRKYKDIQLTRQILGHKDIRNTQIYMNYDALENSKGKIADLYSTKT